MKLRHRRKQGKKHRSGEIPVGSFSDIAFLLIIYFLLATTLVKIHSITADLPTGQKQDQAQDDATPSIVLRGDDVFFNDGKRDRFVSIDELDEMLSGLYLEQKPAEKRVVMLEATDQTPYGIYFRALETISANGGVVALVEEGDE